MRQLAALRQPAIGVVRQMKSLRDRYQDYWFVEIFEFFSSKDHFGSFTLNLLGIYALRTFFSRILFRLGRLHLRNQVPDTLRDQFIRDGYLIVENFYSAEEFAAIKKACDELLEDEKRVMVQEQNGARRRIVNIDANDNAIDKVISDTRIRQLFNYGLGQTLAYGDMKFRIWSVCTTSPTGDDENQNTHSDTSYPAVKAWLYLNDCKPEDGSFNFAPGTHRWSPNRIAWEYLHAARGKNKDVVWRINDDEFQRYGFKPIQELDIKANSLVIADVSGFHRRGNAPIGLERDTVYMSHTRAPCKLRRFPWFNTGDLPSNPDAGH